MAGSNGLYKKNYRAVVVTSEDAPYLSGKLGANVHLHRAICDRNSSPLACRVQEVNPVQCGSECIFLILVREGGGWRAAADCHRQRETERCGDIRCVSCFGFANSPVFLSMARYPL